MNDIVLDNGWEVSVIDRLSIIPVLSPSLLFASLSSINCKLLFL